MDSTRRGKRYVDDAIKKNIFRYSDIYGKVWNSKKDLEELFIQFGKLYKKLKGETLLIIPPDKYY